ncbi:MAG: hypothetical protein AAF211_19755, partial [Myxococcota bacterium]
MQRVSKDPISPSVVLVVEPDELTRHRLRSALGRDDQLVLVAESVADGLVLAKTHAPRVALVSLELPEGAESIEAFDACCDRVVAMAREPGVSDVVDAVRRGASSTTRITSDAP